MKKAAALIPAAGISARYSRERNKLLEKAAGKTVLEHTLRAFDSHAGIEEIVVVLNPDFLGELSSFIEGFGLEKPVRFAAGGADRQASVRSGLGQVESPLVLIHDAARPAVSAECITECIRALQSAPAVLACVPVTDTIKEAAPDMTVRSTPPRDTLYAAQTPQGFHTEFIREAHRKAFEAGKSFTDDAAVAEWAGEKVKIVPGSYNNIKITTPKDMALFRQFAGTSRTLRAGTGIDTHALSAEPGERRLVLGGVLCDWPFGLIGHSDADVLTHAVMDALLGAAALGDIGKLFPPSDDAYKDIDSMLLLQRVGALLAEKGCRIVNIDSVIIAQKPRLSGYIPQMRENIASRLGIDPDAVSVKATTTEHLGFEGRSEGMTAHAVCLIEKETL
ncbi:MAG: 2-C-methyl-D-erythritol 4-phosphate cytidylyltransferase [Abditibacteriota bacterium]|nr:2-C-methyl-D-erythritol 4-phosphate cytidylyltransferase [Abditibacteriota bacterium]